MQYTNFCKLLEAVKEVQKKELRDAVSKHEGFYAFPDNNEPAVEFYGGNGPASACVEHIRLEGGRVLIQVTDDHHDTFDIMPEDLYPGAAQSILENMEEPFKEGDKVFWFDPEADEYGDEKEEMLQREFTVEKTSNREEILISDGYSEAEVPYWELCRVEPEENSYDGPLPMSLIKALAGNLI